MNSMPTPENHRSNQELRNGNKRAHGGKRKNAGRKTSEVVKLRQTLAEKYADEPNKCIAAAIKIRDNPYSKAMEILAANDQILERIIGKAPQAIVHSGSIDMNAEEAKKQLIAGVSEFLSSIKSGVV